MTRHSGLREILDRKLAEEVGELTRTSSEYTEVFHVQGSIGDRDITARITHYPDGENPGSWGGASHWSVTLLDEDGEPLDRHHNPEPTLDLAFQMIDWDRVRESLAS